VSLARPCCGDKQQGYAKRAEYDDDHDYSVISAETLVESESSIWSRTRFAVRSLLLALLLVLVLALVL
jgi:hypothetical protein